MPQRNWNNKPDLLRAIPVKVANGELVCISVFDTSLLVVT